MSTAVALAIVELIKIVGRLLNEARRDKEWTSEQESTIAAAWEEAYKQDHWKPSRRRIKS